MKMPFAAVAFAAFSVLILHGCAEKNAAAYQGYAEGESIRVAAPFAGSLQTLAVRRGQQVAANAPLFALEQENEAAARHEAEARVEAAQARLNNLQMARRPSEVESVRAQSTQAAAQRELSAAQLARQEDLFKQGFISQASLDEARANFRRDAGKLAETTADTRTAQSSVGRDAEIEAARRDVDAAKSALAQNDWRLAQRSVAAPAAGLVQDTFFTQGEWVPAGQPVVSVLPPANIKIRFFVPEVVVGSLKVGQILSVRCDGCGDAIPATISFIAPQPEFTPPIIYSNDSRNKLVFYIEARPAPEQATRLHPGQPLDVTPK